ncbi:I78 family peptidase inhibitor [Pseudomonas anguilliseptica]|uniref:I78 family peptidase inhibitor n=1 Tax=Pseudomonas anguilliseptica TaxID=53406 RepID=UPI003735FDD2
MALRHALASLSLLTLLAGCSSQPPAQQAAEISGDCDVEQVHGALGQTASSELIEQVQQQANAKTLRVLAPGDAATMDYNPQRLNIDIDESEVIIRLTCG